MATTSTATTKAAFVKAVLIEMGSVRLLNKMSGTARLKFVLDRIQTVREYEVVTNHQAMVAYAVAWSVQSLRLNHEPEQALRYVACHGEDTGEEFSMSDKELIAPGIWQYPYTEAGLREAQSDAHYYADDMGHSHWNRHNKGTRHVLTDKQHRAYYGPIGNHWKQDIVWRDSELVYTAEPTEEA